MSNQVTCRKCKATYVPDFMRDFYQDDKDGPGTGLCERCMMNEAFNKDPVDLPPNYEDAICRKGQHGDTCIFLVVAPGAKGSLFKCANGSGLNNTLVEKAQAGKMDARSCNCEGPPNFEPRSKPIKYPTE